MLRADASESLIIRKRVEPMADADHLTPRGSGQQLCFWAGDWLPLPDWACFLIELGSAMAASDNASSRVIAAVATPTRAYAAALCAAGLVLARAALPVSLDAATHFAFLRTLPR